MKRVLTLAALVLAAGSLTTSASAQTAAKAPDPALVDAYMKSTFGKAPPEWQARIEPDETLQDLQCLSQRGAQRGSRQDHRARTGAGGVSRRRQIPRQLEGRREDRQ